MALLIFAASGWSKNSVLFLGFLSKTHYEHFSYCFLAFLLFLSFAFWFQQTDSFPCVCMHSGVWVVAFIVSAITQQGSFKCFFM